MPNRKHKIIILGKLPPPYYGPAVATEILLGSKLKEEFDLLHIDTRLNSSLKTMGKVQLKKMLLTVTVYLNYIKALHKGNVKLVLVPIAQKTSALAKDSFFIILAKMHNKKVLLHLRGSSLLIWYQNSNFIVRFFFKWLFSKCDGGIVLGQKLRYIFGPFFKGNKIFVIPNGANFSFPPKSSTDSKIQILYFGNLISSKGFVDILKAIILLNPVEIDEVKLNVVGSWIGNDYEKSCKSIIEQHHLPVNIYSPMSGNEKFQMFSNADLFVFTPRQPEGHPWAIVEAMAAGLPIISTDQGAITESVLDGKNGFIVESENPEQIADRIKRLIRNPDLRKNMGYESRRLYEENFTEEKMIERLTWAFNSVLNQ
jgi:glycosyltransferase involved in cell wall biosynthesis